MPSLGLTTHAVISKVIDGDTIEITVSHKIRVRMLNLWCPELNTVEGKAAKEYLNSIIPVGTTVIINIPFNKEGNLSPLFTLSRILGIVFKDDKDVSEMMVQAGHGKRAKAFGSLDYEEALSSIIDNAAAYNKSVSG